MRPQLKAGCQPIKRVDGRVQLGTDPMHGVVLDGLGESELALLARLDGVHSTTTLYAVGATLGLPRRRVDDLLAILAEYGVLVIDGVDRAALTSLPTALADRARREANGWSLAYGNGDDGMATVLARATRSVIVVGRGGFGSLLAAHLARAGVGSVHRGNRVAEAAELDESVTPDLVVIAQPGPARAVSAEPWRIRGITHLPVALHLASATIGPIVQPGTGPCLRCVELARTDADPSWPLLAARGEPRPEPVVTGAAALTATVAGLVTMVVLAHLDGVVTGGAVSWRTSLPWPRLEGRRWHVHPLCGNHGTAPAARRQSTMRV